MPKTKTVARICAIIAATILELGVSGLQAVAADAITVEIRFFTGGVVLQTSIPPVLAVFVLLLGLGAGAAVMGSRRKPPPPTRKTERPR